MLTSRKDLSQFHLGVHVCASKYFGFIDVYVVETFGLISLILWQFNLYRKWHPEDGKRRSCYAALDVNERNRP